MGGNQYLNANAQMSPFAGVNGNAFGGGLNGAGGFADTGFGSQSARMGFAHGPAGLQQPQHAQQVQHSMLIEQPTLRSQPNKGRIREVWKHNLHEEMAVLRDLVDKYPYIAMVCYCICWPSVLDRRSRNHLEGSFANILNRNSLTWTARQIGHGISWSRR